MDGELTGRRVLSPADRDVLFGRIMDRLQTDNRLNLTAADWRTSPPAQLAELREVMLDPIIDETLAFDPSPKVYEETREPPAIGLLREAAARFREYERLHLDKVAAEHEVSPHDPDPVTIKDATAKAERNAEIAGKIEAFLAYRASMLRPADPGREAAAAQEFPPAPVKCSCGTSHQPGCPNGSEGQITPDGQVAYHRPPLEGIVTEVQHSIESRKPVTTMPGMVGAGVVVLPTGQPRVIIQVKHPDGTSLAAILNAQCLATITEILEDGGKKAQGIADAASAAASKPN